MHAHLNVRVDQPFAGDSQVNATASTLRPMAMDTSAARAEHISLETTEIDITTLSVRQPHRKVRETYELKCKLRRCSTELALLDDDYLKVRMQRAGGGEAMKYTLDLRFLNSQPTRVRRIAWPLLSASGATLLASLIAFWIGVASGGVLWTHPAFFVACGTMLAALATAFVGLRTTTESLSFTSVHGGAPMVSVIGGLGSTQNGKAFFLLVIKAIAAAKASRQQPKPQLLRDEMREHHRLRELGVLSEADYEASKTKILRAHS